MKSISIVTSGKYYYEDFPEQISKNRNYASVLDLNNRFFIFNKKENRIGLNFLNKHNIDPLRFVCIHVRDSEYMDSRNLSGKNYQMSFRNVNPNTHIPAVEYLISLGYHVIRMGKVVKGNFPFSHKKFTDYSISEYRNDFLDIWLTASCRLFFGPASGIVGLSVIFDTPFLYTNDFPYGRIQSWAHKHVTLPRIALKDGQMLNIKDIVNLDIMGRVETHYYNKIGLKVLENDPQDILNAVKDILYKIDYGFEISEIEKKFWNNLKNEWHKDLKLKWSEPDKYFDFFHRLNDIRVSIPKFYLQKYSNLFLNY